MANYIAWYGKKRARFQAREREFIKVLKTQTNPTKIFEAADELRAAKVRTLKARQAVSAPAESSGEKIAAVEAEIEQWLALSTEAIVQRYRDG